MAHLNNDEAKRIIHIKQNYIYEGLAYREFFILTNKGTATHSYTVRIPGFWTGFSDYRVR